MSVNVTSTSSTSFTLHWVVEQSMQHQLPILYYNLTYSLATKDQSSDNISLPSNASLHRVIGLTPDTEYTISLSAHNRLGTGLKHMHTVATSKGQTLCTCQHACTTIHIGQCATVLLSISQHLQELWRA